MFDRLTQEHILLAFDKADSIGRKAVQINYFFHNGKQYAVKQIFRLAYEIAYATTAPEFVPNQVIPIITGLGFKTYRTDGPGPELSNANQANSQSFTWVPFYQEMCPKLLQYRPADLINIIKQVLKVQNLAGLKDRLTEGSSNDTELTDIDPYTFLSYLNKTGNTKRLMVLTLLRDIMNLTAPAPTDVNGLPNSQAQSVWMFGYAYIRKPDDIDQLRNLYNQVENNSVTAEQFEMVLTIYKVGRAKLTEALFCQKPTDYLPINAQTIPWLKKRNLPSRYTNFAEYNLLLEEVRKADPRPFYEISWEAYLENNPPAKSPPRYYCVDVTFGGQDDQLARFIQEGVWQNDHRNENDQYTDLIKNIPVGAKLAAKLSTRGPQNEAESVLQIKAIGEVVANSGDGQNLDVLWEESFEPFSLSRKGYYRKPVQQVTNAEDIKLIFFHQSDQPTAVMSSSSTNYPNNIILYGPPGTGKTYGTIDLAVHIIDGHISSDHSTNKTRFDQFRKDGQIEFVTFHQNYTYEDFVIGLKPDVESGTLKFEQREGIFYKLAKVARQNYEASQLSSTGNTYCPFSEVIEEYLQPLIDFDKPVNVPMPSGKSFQLNGITDNSIKFVKFNGNEDHSFSIATLERLYQGVMPFPTGGMKTYYKPLVEVLRERGKTEKQNVAPKNYVLIIDEINRANMSRVFGELITLLEDDKRLGGENELTVTLPSGESFSVPPNLYLIGTMNTADKSLALLDIALRRRFEFIGKYPNYDVVESPAKRLLEQLNKAILAHNKPADFLVGHAYFIGKQANQLPDVFNNRIIPLLMEYFNNRTDMVKTLLKAAGVESERHPLTDQLTVSYVGEAD